MMPISGSRPMAQLRSDRGTCGWDWPPGRQRQTPHAVIGAAALGLEVCISVLSKAKFFITIS